MKSLSELRKEYEEELIEKATYIEKMYGIHKLLFDYSEFIKNTDISKIEISDNSVIMTSRSRLVKIKCDINDKRVIPIEILNFKKFENEELNFIIKLIRSNIKDPFVFFDIGANIGWYSINISKSTKDIEIFAFEPIKKTYNSLIENIEINQLKDKIITANFGFLNEEKTLTFYYDSENSGSASLTNITEKENIEEVVCKVKTIDDFVMEKKINIDFIKCDVEGAELFVYQGGINTIKECKPIIFSEMLRKWAAKFNYHPNDIIELFEEIGYKCYRLKDNKLIELIRMDDTIKETNFFFLHPEKHKIP